MALPKFAVPAAQLPVELRVLLAITAAHCAFVGTLKPAGQGSVAVLLPSAQAPLAAESVFQGEIGSTDVVSSAT